MAHDQQSCQLDLLRRLSLDLLISGEAWSLGHPLGTKIADQMGKPTMKFGGPKCSETPQLLNFLGNHKICNSVLPDFRQPSIEC
jgi:hypothetical protein